METNYYATYFFNFTYLHFTRGLLQEKTYENGNLQGKKDTNNENLKNKL